MFERFTDRARRVVVLAQEEARLLDHGYIGTEHLLLGLIHEGEGVAAKALESLGIELIQARLEVENMIGTGDGAPAGHIPFTPRAKKVLELSLRESLQLGHQYIGTEHVLLGLVREGTGVAAQVLMKLGASVDATRTTVITILTGHGTVPPAEPVTRQAFSRVVATATDRYSPGLRRTLHAAESFAGDAVVGTHHVLSMFAAWDDVAANQILRAGGFDISKLDTPITAWDVAGTRDETPEQWALRVTEVAADDEGVFIRVTDPVLRDRIREQIESGNAATVEATLGQALHKARAELPESVGETGNPSEAAAAGGEEHDQEQGGADEDDGGA